MRELQFNNDYYFFIIERVSNRYLVKLGLDFFLKMVKIEEYMMDWMYELCDISIAFKIWFEICFIKI